MQNDTKCFYDLLGWQGGTIHQVAEELGVTSEQLLYGQPSVTWTDSDYMKGQFAFDTCTIEFTKTKLLPMYKGNIDFWLGYKRAHYLDSLV